MTRVQFTGAPRGRRRRTGCVGNGDRRLGSSHCQCALCVCSGVDYEIVIVDDNSPDGTQQIVHKLQQVRCSPSCACVPGGERGANVVAQPVFHRRAIYAHENNAHEGVWGRWKAQRDQIELAHTVNHSADQIKCDRGGGRRTVRTGLCSSRAQGSWGWARHTYTAYSSRAASLSSSWTLT